MNLGTFDEKNEYKIKKEYIKKIYLKFNKLSN